MTKRVLIWLGLMGTLCASTPQAAPLRNIPQTLVQPNGDTVRCFATGDEFYHRLHDANGYTIVLSPTSGYWVYAVSTDNRLSRGIEHVVDQVDPATIGIEPNIAISREEYLERREEWLGPDGYQRSAPTTGTIRHIVIFIRFAGEPEFTTLVQDYNYRLKWAIKDTNSVRNYFEEDTYGQLEIVSHFYPVSPTDTVVSYQDSLTRDYYRPYNAVTNPNGYDTVGGTSGNPTRCVQVSGLFRRAVTSVQPEINPALIVDADGDSRVDAITFIARGGTDGWGEFLWPHCGSMHCDSVSINGARVMRYVMMFDSNYTTSTQCHETSHALGFPDLYHYDEAWEHLSPVSSWGLMDWNRDPPQHHLMHMKYRYGNWLSPSQMPLFYRGTRYVHLNKNSPSSSSPTAYRLGTNPLLAGDEYLVAELRKKEGVFDQKIPATGLLLYRINPNVAGNAGFPPNEVYIFRPGGQPDVIGNINQAHFGADVDRYYLSTISNPYLFLSDSTLPHFLVYDIGPLEGDSIELSFSYQYYTAASTLTGTWNKYSSTSDNLYWVSADAIRHAVSTFTIENGARVYGEPGKKIFCDGGSFEVTAGSDWTRIYTLNGYKSGIKAKGQIKVYNLGTIKFK